jgi:hypothetical protein
MRTIVPDFPVAPKGIQIHCPRNLLFPGSFSQECRQSI